MEREIIKPKAVAEEILPKIEVVSNELYVDGEKFVLDARQLIGVSVRNESGTVRIEFAVNQIIGRVKALKGYT